jgi:serine/threonine-protein kinase
VGQRIDDSSWEKTVMMALPRPARPPQSPPTFSPPARAAAPPARRRPTHWDKALLTQAEQSLARRRPSGQHPGASRGPGMQRPDELYSRLAEQVTDPRAGDAFLGQASPVTGGAHRTAGSPSSGGSRGSTAGPAGSHADGRTAGPTQSSTRPRRCCPACRAHRQGAGQARRDRH